MSPPVLPVLQEMHPGPNKPEHMVDGWNAWFQSDRKIISQWPGWGKNRMTVGDLWIGFLDFFSRAWDDKKLVVSIRQARHLTKFEKMWISPCIAIEDPFELSHNLGAGISRKSKTLSSGMARQMASAGQVQEHGYNLGRVLVYLHFILLQ